MGLFDGIGSALAGGLLSLVGGERRNSAAADQAEAANAFSAQQYATRYQTTVKDMQAAGLNPMLAYSQGPGSSPTGQQAQMQDTISPAVSTFQAQRLNSAQVANIQADTSNKEAQADLIQAQAAQAWASAGQSNANIGLINMTVDKVKAETEKIKGDTNFQEQQQILRNTVYNLYQQGNLAQERGLSEGQSRSLMEATIRKIATETKLNQLDIDAALKFDNFGREYKQYAPIIELLKTIFRPRGGGITINK